MYYKVITEDVNKMYEVFCMIYPELEMSLDDLFRGSRTCDQYEMGIDMTSGEYYICGRVNGIPLVRTIADTCPDGPLGARHRWLVYNTMSKLKWRGRFKRVPQIERKLEIKYTLAKIKAFDKCFEALT